MGRHSCCVKQKLRKGLWSPEEDEKLFNHITRFGVGCWSSVPKLAGLQRCGKSCRLRWINYLRPDLKRGMFSQQEEDIILSLHEVLGNRWAQIAAQLPGRTDNEIKNFWNSCLKKKLLKQGIDPATHKPFTHQPQIIKQEINNGLETTPAQLCLQQNMHHFSNLASSQSQQGPPFLMSDSSYYDAAVLTEASCRDEILMMSNKPHECWVDPLSYYDSYTSHHQYQNQYGSSLSSYGMICSSMPSLTSSDHNNLSSAITEFSDNNNNNNSGSKISSSNNSSNMSSYVVENNNNNNGGMLSSWEGENKTEAYSFQVNGVKSEEVVMNTTSSWQETVQLQNHGSIDFNSYPLITSFSQDLTAATYDVFRQI